MRWSDWDDKIPEDIRQKGINNFEMIQEISGVRFPRTIVPDDEINLDVETIDTADTSPHMIGCNLRAIYEKKQRFLLSVGFRTV